MLFQFLANTAISDIMPDIARTRGFIFDTVLAKSEITRSPIAKKPPRLLINCPIPNTNSENFHAAKNASTASVIFSTNVWF